MWSHGSKASNSLLNFLTFKIDGEFPVDLGVRIWGFHSCSQGSVPGQGTEMLQGHRESDMTEQLSTAEHSTHLSSAQLSTCLEAKQ